VSVAVAIEPTLGGGRAVSGVVMEPVVGMGQAFGMEQAFDRVRS
jgi:hypothetical protein